MAELATVGPVVSRARPVHVLRLTPHFYWPQLEERSWPVKFDAIGGMQTQIYRLAAALPGEDVEQTILTLRLPHAPRIWEVHERCQVRGVRIPVLPLRSRVRGMVDLNLAWSLGVFAEGLRSRPPVDVIHVHCSGVLCPPLVGVILQRFLGVPLILTVHCSILATYHPMTTLDRLLRPLACSTEHAAVRAAARVIVLTPRLLTKLSEATGVGAERFVVLPDSIDATAFARQATPARSETFRRRFRLPRGGHTVGYVGRVAREKGWPTIVQAAAQLRSEPIHWLVCGDGNERDAMETAVRQAGLAERFTITGYLPNHEVPAAMAAMDLLLLPSMHEEFGGVMLEAMAMAVPIVAFDVGGVSHVLEGGRLGRLVEARSVAGFVEAIREGLHQVHWRRAVTARARRAVEERYRTDQVAARLAQVYRETLAG